MCTVIFYVDFAPCPLRGRDTAERRAPYCRYFRYPFTHNRRAMCPGSCIFIETVLCTLARVAIKSFNSTHSNIHKYKQPLVDFSTYMPPCRIIYRAHIIRVGLFLRRAFPKIRPFLRWGNVCQPLEREIPLWANKNWGGAGISEPECIRERYVIIFFNLSSLVYFPQGHCVIDNSTIH